MWETLSREKRISAINAYEKAGYTNAQIGKRMNVSSEAIRKFKFRSGMRSPGFATYTKQNIAEVWCIDPDSRRYRDLMVAQDRDFCRKMKEVLGIKDPKPKVEKKVIKPAVVASITIDHICNRPKSSIAEEVIAQEAERNDTTRKIMRSGARNVRVTRARMMSALRLFHYTKLSYPAIARMVGYADHASVIHAVKKLSGGKTPVRGEHLT